VRAGFRQGDAIAALAVAAIVVAAATRLLLINARVLMDTAPADAQVRALQAVEGLTSDVELRRLRVRESAGRYFADVVVDVPPGQAVIEGHATADEVEAAIHQALPNSDVVVHVEPRRRGLALRDRVLAAALSEPDVHEAHDITIFDHDGEFSVSLHLKFADDLPLEEAHAIAERVEQAIAAEPGVLDVQTHLEPLERPLTAAAPRGGYEEQAARRVTEMVTERMGEPPRTVRLLPTDAGCVVFLTIPVKPGTSLNEAHKVASELEEILRSQDPELADVVVHTEP
jgi:divalent metal cation (Fe/Co/Zn/Cd) transporter